MRTATLAAVLCFYSAFTMAQVERVYIADDGSTYHLRDCPTIAGISKIVEHQRSKLPPLSEACSICRPDEKREELAPIVIGPTAPAVPVAPRWTLGAQLLTATTYQEAITCGTDSPWWRACAEENLTLCSTPHVQVSLRTPFVLVMMDTDRAAKQFETPRPPSLAVANRVSATVMVSPGSDMTTMRSPTRMLIEKNGVRTSPTTTTMVPAKMQNMFGVSRNAASGAFTFPLNLFAPTSPTTLLIALNAGGPVTCELGVEKLKQLR